MKYIVAQDKVLVRRHRVTDEDSGILIPDKVRKKPTKGTVEGIGSNITFVAEGDVVVFSEYSGVELDDGSDGLEESDLLVMELDEILAKVEE